MPYNLPDVFVNVDIPAPSPTITAPGLSPCVVGEHYFIAKDKFVANVSPGDSGPWSYPDLPDSTNDNATKLSVDVSSTNYSPTFYMVTDAGEEIDITDQIDPTSSEFSLATNGSFPESGSLFVSYRARHDKYAGTNMQILTAATFDDLTNLFGTDGITPGNPLGYAMYQTWVENQIEVKGVAVTNPTSGGTGSYSDPISNESLAYQQAFDFLKKRDVYTVVPLTFNSKVHGQAEAHVDYMSRAQGGNEERRTIVVPEMDGNTAIRRGNDFTPWYLISDSGTSTDLEDSLGGEDVGAEITRGGYRIVKAADGSPGTYYIRGYVPSSNPETITIDGNDYDVDAGSTWLIELDGSVVRPSSQRIKSSDSFTWVQDDGTEISASIQAAPLAQHENILEVDASSASATEGEAWEVIRSVDPVTQRSKFVDNYKLKATGIGNERVTLVTPHWIGDTQVGHDVPAYFVAAQIAGEVCLTSEQPAGAAPGVDTYAGTRESTSHLFKSVRYFTNSELEEIAASGWTILQNSRPGAALNTMHTVTTDTGSVERMELILGVERDFLARYFRSELDDELRDFRINDRTLNTLAIRAGTVAAALSSPNSNNYRYRDVSVTNIQQDPSQPDRVIFDVEAEHLYPFNQGKVNVSIVT